MAVTQMAMARHPFADGSYKQMLIDGKWLDAASGRRFETRNPATGELLASYLTKHLARRPAAGGKRKPEKPGA